MTTITISDKLYKDLEQTAKESNMSFHSFVVQALNTIVKKAKPKHKYKLKSVENLPKEIRDLIGIAKNANVKDNDINGNKAREEYLAEKYNL